MNDLRKIEAILPGAGLDALIAKHVMGWDVHEAIPNEYRLPLYVLGDVTYRAEPFDWNLWNPSGEIGAAWDVIERIKPVRIFVATNGSAIVTIRIPCPTNASGSDPHIVAADCAPLAICRAALIWSRTRTCTPTE